MKPFYFVVYYLGLYLSVTGEYTDDPFMAARFNAPSDAQWYCEGGETVKKVWLNKIHLKADVY